MATKKEYATRFGLFTIAMLFLVTSVGFSILVIWQNSQQNKKEDAAMESSQVDSTSELNVSDSTEAENNNEGDTVLQGTKLQNFTSLTKIDALQSIDSIVGTGAEAKAGDTVTAHYTGAVAADGTIFQSSHDGPNQPIPFGLNQVIKGWTDGVPGMKVGGTRRLLIPADQAYGGSPPQGSGIPANADLVFDIELVKIGE